MPQKIKEYSQSAASTDRQMDRQLTFTDGLLFTDLGNDKRFRASACEFLTTPTLQFLFTAKATEFNFNLI